MKNRNNGGLIRSPFLFSVLCHFRQGTAVLNIRLHFTMPRRGGINVKSNMVYSQCKDIVYKLYIVYYRRGG